MLVSPTLLKPRPLEKSRSNLRPVSQVARRTAAVAAPPDPGEEADAAAARAALLAYAAFALDQQARYCQD
jgi:hypothetical protein